MSTTHQINRSYQTQAGIAANVVASYIGDVEKNLDTNVAPSTTDQPISVQWVAAKVQSMMFWASGAAIVKTNSASTPTTTINLAANQIVQWGTSDPPPMPVPGDVTAGLFVSNAGATAIQLKIRVLSSV